MAEPAALLPGTLDPLDPLVVEATSLGATSLGAPHGYGVLPEL